MKAEVKCGLITAVVWNIVLVAAFAVNAVVKGLDADYYLCDEEGYSFVPLYFFWSVIWYTIGRHGYKEYVAGLAVYRERYTLIEEHTLRKEYRRYAIQSKAGMLVPVFALAIPWYIFEPDYPSMDMKDVCVIAVLAFISLTLYKVSRRNVVAELGEAISMRTEQEQTNFEEEGKMPETLVAKFNALGESAPGATCHVTDEDWQNLFVEMSKHDSDFMLRQRKAGLSDMEGKVATLIRLHFEDYQIKRILDTYGSALPTYKARVNKKMFNHEGARTLRRWIYACR